MFLRVLTDAIGLTWRLRWTLLVVTAIALVPALLVRTAAGFVTLRSSVSIVNGELTIFARNDILGGGGRLADAFQALNWATTAALTLGWTAAVTAAMVVVGGMLRSGTAGVRTAMRLAVGRLGRVFVAVIALGIVTAVAVWLTLGLLAALGATSSVVVWAGMVGVALLIARLSLVLPALTFASHAPLDDVWRMTRGRLTGVLVPVVVGAGVVPLLLVTVVGRIGAGVVDEVALTGTAGVTATAMAAVAADFALVVAVALQGAVLAVAYLECQPTTDDEVGTTVTALAHATIHPAGWPRCFASALVAVPALVVAGVTIANPYGGLEVHRTVAEFYPDRPGVHPLWTECSDDCRRSINSAMDWDLYYDGSTVLSDGTWISVIRSELDTLHIQRCRPDAPTCGSGGDSVVITWPSVQPGSEKAYAVTAMDDGRVWIAAAEQVAVDDPQPDMTTNLEFSVLACDDWTCESATHATLGRSQGSLGTPEDPMAGHASLGDDEFDSGRFVAHAYPDPEPGPPLALSLDPEGVPLVVYDGWGTAALATCGTVECDAPRVVEHVGGSVPIGGIDDGLVTLLGPSVTYCRGTECDHASIDGIGTLLPVADSGIVAGEFGVVAVLSETVPRDGVHISVGGTSQASWRTVLLHCDDFACSEPRLVPIDITNDRPEDPALMVTAGKSVRLWYRIGWDEHEVTLTLD